MKTTSALIDLSPDQVMRKIKQAQSRKTQPKKAQNLLGEAKLACHTYLQLTRPIPYGAWLEASLMLCTAFEKQSNIEYIAETKALAMACDIFLEKHSEHLEAKQVEDYRKQIQAILDKCNKKLKPIALEIKKPILISIPPVTLKQEISTLLTLTKEQLLKNGKFSEQFITSGPGGLSPTKITAEELLKKSHDQMIIWEINPKDVVISPILDYFLLFLTIFNSTKDPIIDDCLLRITAACQKIFGHFEAKDDNFCFNKIMANASNIGIRLSRDKIDEEALDSSLTEFLELDYNLPQADFIFQIIESTTSIIQSAITHFHKIENQEKMMEIIYKLFHKTLITFKKFLPDAKNNSYNKVIFDFFSIMDKFLEIQMLPGYYKILINEIKQIIHLFLTKKSASDTIRTANILQNFMNLIKNNYLQLKSEKYWPIFSELIDMGLIFSGIPGPDTEEKFCLTALTELKSHIGKAPCKPPELKVEPTFLKIAFEKFSELKPDASKLLERISDELKLTEDHKEGSSNRILAEKILTAKMSLQQPLEPTKDPKTIKVQLHPLVDFLVSAAHLYHSASTLSETTFSTVTTILNFSERIITLYAPYGFFIHEQALSNYIRFHGYLLCLKTYSKEEVNRLLDNILSFQCQNPYFLYKEIILINSSTRLCSQEFSSIQNARLLIQLRELGKRMISNFTHLPLIYYLNIEQHKNFYALTVEINLIVAVLYLKFEGDKEKNNQIASSIINDIYKFVAARKSIVLTKETCLMVLNTIVQNFTTDISLSERLEITAQQRLLKIAQAFTPIKDPGALITTCLETIKLMQWHLQPEKPVEKFKPQATQKLDKPLEQKTEKLTESRENLKRLQKQINEKTKENERIQKEKEEQSRLHQEDMKKIKSELKQTSRKREKQNILIQELEAQLDSKNEQLRLIKLERDGLRSALLESEEKFRSLHATAGASILEQNTTIGHLFCELQKSKEQCATLLQKTKPESEAPRDEIKPHATTQQSWQPAFSYTPKAEPKPEAGEDVALRPSAGT